MRRYERSIENRNIQCLVEVVNAEKERRRNGDKQRSEESR